MTEPATGPAAGRSSHSSARREHNGDDETIKSQSLSEDHHENKGDQDISLGVSTDTSVTDDANAKASGEGGETTAETSSESLVSFIVSVAPFAGVFEIFGSVFDLGDCKRVIRSGIKDRSD